MLDFRPICLEDRAWIEPVMQAAAGHGSEFSFVNLYLWGDQRVASVDGTPVFLSNFSGSLTYPWPVGCRDLPGTLELLRQDACERGIPLRLFGLLPEERDRLEALCPGAVLQGCAFAMAGLIHLRLHSFGNLEFLTRVPMSIRAGLGGDLVNFILCVAVFFAAGYAIAYFMIGRFHFATPGRLGNYTDDSVSENSQGRAGFASSGDSQAGRIISLLGGRDNIVLVDACMTRLRVTVKDVDKVAGLPQWKAEGAMGLIKKDGGIQAIYGPKADVLKSIQGCKTDPGTPLHYPCTGRAVSYA